jgi:hypothetical protein
VRWVALLLLAPLPALAQEEKATVYVENATAAQDLLALLREEMPRDAFADTASLADLRANLSDALRLVIADRYGITMLDRALEGGRDAAVRVAALLIVEARESWRGAAPPIAPLRVKTAVTATRSWSIGASAGIGVSMWSEAPSAQLVVPLSIYVAVSDFEIGVGGSIGGFLPVETDAIRGVPRAYALWVEGRWSFWRPLETIATSLWIAGGAQTESVTARVRAPGGFAASGPEEQQDLGWSPIARAGLGASVLIFDWVRIGLDLGAQLQRSETISLPDEMEYQGLEISRGWVVAWSKLTVGVEI